MRIRVANVAPNLFTPAGIFKTARSRKHAWVTGSAGDRAELNAAADGHGYALWSTDQNDFWVAVRKDLFVEGVWDGGSEEKMTYVVLETTTPGLGEIVVASGDDIDGEFFNIPLVFHAGLKDGEVGFGFYDESGRVAKMRTSPSPNSNFLETTYTLSELE